MARKSGVRAKLKRLRERLRKRFANRKHRTIWLALLYRPIMPHVTYVGVTGSCAKTTTTRLIGAVLNAAGPCRTRDDNGPSHVSRNVLSVGLRTRFCVQEVAGESPGKIRTQTRILKPQIGVVTNIGGDHYRSFRSLEATAKEKGRLVEDLPGRGIAILNADDPNVIGMRTRTKARIVTFGLSPDADVTASDISSHWPDCLALTVAYGGERQRIQTKHAGEFWTTSVLAAVACGVACGVDLKSCASAIERVEPKFGRYSVHPVPGGPVFVYDHKAPVWTIPHCLAFLANAVAPRRTVVFGTISDTASKSSQVYRRVARQALDAADRVVFVGQGAHHIRKLRQAEIGDRLVGFQTVYEASAYFKEQALTDELIVLKGSRTADHLERIMLSQLGPVVCWKERCGRKLDCPNCSRYTRPSPPVLPFSIERQANAT
ncbi:MAG: Mur ligase family protein [Methyloceanibacter sp.]